MPMSQGKARSKGGAGKSIPIECECPPPPPDNLKISYIYVNLVTIFNRKTDFQLVTSARLSRRDASEHLTQL